MGSDLDKVCLAAGRALMAAQAFEYGVKLLLWLLADQRLIDFNLDDAGAIIEGRRRTTLGQVLNVLNQKVGFTKDDAAILRQGLNDRNRLVHFFFLDNKEALAGFAIPAVAALGNSASDRVNSDLAAIRRNIRSADAVVNRSVQSLLRLYGIDLDGLTQSLVEAINRSLG